MTAKAPEDAYTAEPFVPDGGDLAALRRAASGCRGVPCNWGSSPGIRRTGRGSRSPAGKLLGRALAETGIDPGEAYVTNAVKHFKFTRAEPRKRRIHKAPSLREMTACGPWLAAEPALVEPKLVVVLGATAGKALLGSSFRVTRVRGTVLEEEIHGRPERLVPTVHPPPSSRLRSSREVPPAVLRAEDREGAYQGLVADLKAGARLLA
ncbi:uracil-DNA glycosylase family protein [Streptomyces sp. B93]|uniref:uracil-DNA glycosylase family protein n=1 Tax=Streptomyces sp. B93 TaxID=2824875 RepID=UPI002495215E|nr:uracil-DNA glycosylase family protein [Streptomyces sp. B93]